MSAFETKKYSYKKGVGFWKVSAQTVGNAIEMIKEEKGYATKEDLLEYSRPLESDTHALFEWDDSIAAEKYRLAQAGLVMRQLEVEIIRESANAQGVNLSIKKTEPTIRTRAFVNIEENYGQFGTPGRFVGISEALSNDTYRDRVLENARKELLSFKTKYQTLVELENVFAVIDEFVR